MTPTKLPFNIPPYFTDDYAPTFHNIKDNFYQKEGDVNQKVNAIIESTLSPKSFWDLESNSVSSPPPYKLYINLTIESKTHPWSVILEQDPGCKKKMRLMISLTTPWILCAI